VRFEKFRHSYVADFDRMFQFSHQISDYCGHIVWWLTVVAYACPLLQQSTTLAYLEPNLTLILFTHRNDSRPLAKVIKLTRVPIDACYTRSSLVNWTEAHQISTRCKGLSPLLTRPSTLQCSSLCWNEDVIGQFRRVALMQMVLLHFVSKRQRKD